METKEPIVWPCWGLYYSEQIRGWREAYGDASVFMRGSKISQWLSCGLCPFAFYLLVSASKALAPVKNYPSSSTKTGASHQCLTGSSFSFFTLWTSPPFLSLLFHHHQQPPHQPPASWTLLVTSHTLLPGSPCLWLGGRGRVNVSEPVCARHPTIESHWPAFRMDKPSVWRAVVSSTDPRRTRDPGSHSSRPGSAMGYRLYDMWVACSVGALSDRRTGRLARLGSASIAPFIETAVEWVEVENTVSTSLVSMLSHLWHPDLVLSSRVPFPCS